MTKLIDETVKECYEEEIQPYRKTDYNHPIIIIFCSIVFNYIVIDVLLLQAVIDANIFPILIEILGKAEFKTRKEAAWAITNATSGGSPEQIR